MNKSANQVVHKPSLVTKFKFVENLSKKKKKTQNKTDFEVLTEMNIKITDFIILKKPAVSIPDDGGSKGL
jgi:hypothetical protein